MLFRQVSIVGTGLLGSSLGLALKRYKLAGCVIGVSGAAAEALRVGAVDAVAELAEAAPDSDLVVLAQPIRRLLQTMQGLDAHLAEGVIVTDVGSTKSVICEAASQYIKRGRFVGGHPMAGKERRGPDGASADLFAGRTWILTAQEPRLEALIRDIGAKPLLLSPEEHDRLVARASHVPQLLSTALASYLEGSGAEKVAGPGLKDMTRLALSSFELWDDILATNEANIDAVLAGFIQHLEVLRQKGFTEAFAEGTKFAQRIPRS